MDSGITYDFRTTNIGPIVKLPSMPINMEWKIGNFVENSMPVILGEDGLKYIISGWKRLTSGDANILNVDWVEIRSYIGI